MKYQIELITDNKKRGVAFLISDDIRVTAKQSFNNLTRQYERMLRSRFDLWLSGKVYPKGYHGWDKSEFKGKYTKCFVFKCGKVFFQGPHHRFYGFLCNKIKQNNPGYELCVLCIYTRKTEKETHGPDLELVEELGTTLAIQKTIRDFIGGES